MPVVLAGILGSVGSALLGMVVKSLSQGAVERLVLLGLRKLAESTASEVDDEVYGIVKRAVEGPREADLLPEPPAK